MVMDYIIFWGYIHTQRPINLFYKSAQNKIKVSSSKAGHPPFQGNRYSLKPKELQPTSAAAQIHSKTKNLHNKTSGTSKAWASFQLQDTSRKE